MTTGDDNDLERGGDDLLAAEYVLGVLPADERGQAARRVETDPAFASLVDGWEVRLSPLAAGYDPVDVPVAVKAAIDRRLFSAPAATAPSGMLAGLAFWRGLAIAAVAGLIALAVWTAAPWLQPSGAPQAERLVASLASDETDVRYLVVYDGDKAEIAMSHVTGARAPERDFELWVIGGGEVLSLGVVPVGASVQLPVEGDLRQKIQAGAQFAITLEPLGGSPTGVATGPIVAAGDLRTI
jgi:anti-sigma-K factor RskA